MIASLRGTLRDKFAETVVIDVGGVGYLVTPTGRAFAKCGSVGQTIELIIYTDVKETSIQLFGFADLMEREVFLLLKKVKGIGPKHSMSIVSALGAEGLLTAIGRRDFSRLQQVPGVGKKTAERILVELREQVGELVSEIASNEDSGVGPIEIVREPKVANSPLETDAILALEKLGFSRDRAKGAVSQALGSAKSSQLDAGELLRLSLAHL